MAVFAVKCISSNESAWSKNSGNLFDIYFGKALNKVREVLGEIEKIRTMLPDETIYADDAEFLTQELQKKRKITD